MNSKYDKLSPEDKVLVAIQCVARGVPIPGVIKTFLEGEGLLDSIMKPGKQR